MDEQNKKIIQTLTGLYKDIIYFIKNKYQRIELRYILGSGIVERIHRKENPLHYQVQELPTVYTVI